MLKKIFKNSLIYGLAPQIPMIANIIALPFITPHLSDIDFGVRGVILSYLGAIMIFQGLGLRIVYANAFFHYPKQFKWLWRQLLGFEWLWSIIFQLILAAFLFFIIPTEALENKRTIIILLVLPHLLFGPLAKITVLRYQLEENPIPITLRSISFGVLGVLLTYYFIAILDFGYIGWFWSTFIVSILKNLSYIYPGFYLYNLYPIFNFKWRLIKKSLKVALPAIPHYYSMYLLNSSDRIVMDNLNITTSDIGIYSKSYALAGKFSVVGTALGLAVGPTYRKLLKEKNEIALKKLTFILQSIFILGSFIVAIWLKELFAVFFRGHDIGVLVPLGIIILMGYNYRPMYLSNSVRIMYYEKTKSLWKISFGAGILNVILNFIFIPFFGYQAAAYTTFIALIYMGFSAFYLKEYKSISTLDYHPILWIILIFVVTALALILVNISIISKVFLTLSISIVLLLNYNKIKKIIKI